MSDESDSDVDENLDLLREALDTDFLNNRMFDDTKDDKNGDDWEVKAKSPAQKPSLRLKPFEEESDGLKVTAEFRKHVGKRLDELLERRITYREPKKDISKWKRKEPESKVKLLRGSRGYVAEIDQPERANYGVRRPAGIKQRVIAGNELEDRSLEALRQIAVSGEDILNQTEARHWSKRSKAPVFRYRRGKDGQLVYIEPLFIR